MEIPVLCCRQIWPTGRLYAGRAARYWSGLSLPAQSPEDDERLSTLINHNRQIGFISEGNSAQLLRLLAAHEIDMVVTNFLPSGSDSKGLLSRLIAKKNISIYAASDFKTLKKNFPKSLSAQPLIVPTYDSRLRQDLDHWGKTNKLELNIITETQDVSVQTLMAINSMGLIPAAAHTVADDVRAGKLIEIGKLQGVYEELFLLTAQRKIVNPVAAELMKNFEV